MKTVILLLTLACAALAAPRQQNERHIIQAAVHSQENKSPAFEKPHFNHIEANEPTEDTEQNVDESIHMAKAAFGNLEKDLNKVEEPEQSANVVKAKQALLEDARKTFRELQALRFAALNANKPDEETTSEIEESETEKMTQWNGEKKSVLSNQEGLIAPKAIEMEESASNNKKTFRAPDEPEANKDFTSSTELKSAEDVKQPTKNLDTENITVKNTLNRNAVRLIQDMHEVEKLHNIDMEKNVNLEENSRSSTQFLDNTNRGPTMNSAEHIDSKWSSTQNNEKVVNGKSAEFEDTGDSAQLGNHFVIDHERASQADLPWRPPGSKLHMRNHESELMGENMQWKNYPESDESDMRSAYGGAYGIGGTGNAGIISGAGAGSSGAGTIGIFPNAQVSNCAIPLLLSCSPSVVSGSLGKSYGSSYGSSAGTYGSSAGTYGSSAGAYRSSHKVKQPSKRDAKKLNRIDLTKTKRPVSKDYPQYRIVPNMY